MYMPYMFNDDIFDDLFDLGRSFMTTNDKMKVHRIPTDILEDEEGFEMKMNLPGYMKENIRVELQEGVLTVTANAGKDPVEGGTCLRRERNAGMVSRRFNFRTELDKAQIRASYENGVLTLNLPKKKAERNRIAIEG